MNATLKKTGQKLLTGIVKSPKRFFTYSMIVLSLSFIGSLIQGIFFPCETTFTIKPPVLYSGNGIRQNTSFDHDKEMEKIVNELKFLRAKRDRNALQKADSLRIEFLFNRYQYLKNSR